MFMKMLLLRFEAVFDLTSGHDLFVTSFRNCAATERRMVDCAAMFVAVFFNISPCAFGRYHLDRAAIARGKVNYAATGLSPHFEL